MSPTVSVVIPTLNSAHLLPRAIRSILAQSRPAQEIIVVDDGSTDDTQTLLAEEFPDVIVISQSNRGASIARNRGVEAAQGEWIAFLDADDEWRPEKLRRQLTLIEKHPEAVFVSTGRVIAGRRPHRYLKYAFRWRFTRLFQHNQVYTPSVLIRREIFKAYGGFDPILKTGEDWELWLRVIHDYPGYGLTHKDVVLHKVQGSLSDDALRIGLNNITIMERWNPRINSRAGISFRTYRRIVWRRTSHRLRKLCVRKNINSATFLAESLLKLPFSRFGRWSLRFMLWIMNR